MNNIIRIIPQQGIFKKLALMVLCLFLLQGLPLMAQESGQPTVQEKTSESEWHQIVMVVLDVSGSMKPHFEKVKQILTKEIIENILKQQDYFLLIQFGDKAKVVYSAYISREDDKKSIANAIHNMTSNDQNTDLGLALQQSLKELKTLKYETAYAHHIPLVFFITDGKQDAKPDSPFYEKTIQQIFQKMEIHAHQMSTYFDGWYIIGIGGKTDVPELAQLMKRPSFTADTTDLASQLEGQIRLIHQERLKLQVEQTTSPLPLPGFWEKYGLALFILAGLVLLCILLFIVMANKTIPVVMELEGQETSPVKYPKTVRMKWRTQKIMGSGLRDDFRIDRPGWPESVARISKGFGKGFRIDILQKSVFPSVSGQSMSYRLGEKMILEDPALGALTIKFVHSRQAKKPDRATGTGIPKKQSFTG